jgi:hypothetical protein
MAEADPLYVSAIRFFRSGGPGDCNSYCVLCSATLLGPIIQAQPPRQPTRTIFAASPGMVILMTIGGRCRSGGPQRRLCRSAKPDTHASTPSGHQPQPRVHHRWAPWVPFCRTCSTEALPGGDDSPVNPECSHRTAAPGGVDVRTCSDHAGRAGLLLMWPTALQP